MDSWHDELLEDEHDTGWSDTKYEGKGAIIFLIDVNSPDMHKIHGDDEDTPLQKSLKCVHACLRREVLHLLNFSKKYCFLLYF